MADWTVTFKGLKELQDTLHAFPEEVQAAPMRAFLKDMSAVVQDGMKRRAPRDPEVQGPTLAEDIGVVVKVSTKKWYAFAHVGPLSRVFYGRFLELGTSKMAARPSFMRAALDEDGQVAVSAGANGLRRAIDRLAVRFHRRFMARAAS